ncbi:MAG: type IV pilus biogenesis protein PilP [Alphaproteobacteria bacterium]|nr:type IV pilus biogenesis protein PilP [Alphaproteobacteria bacterium SS10]
MLEKRYYSGVSVASVVAAAMIAISVPGASALAQGDASQFAPDASVFRQLTDLQRQISVLEREVVLEDLRLRRRELDLQMQELEQRNADRRLDRERIQREEREARERLREEEEKAVLEEERQRAIREAEEDLRISELRAQREALLRSLEIQTQREEQALEAEEAAAAAAAAQNEADSAAEAAGVTVDAAQVRQRQRVERTVPREGSLIVAPGAPVESPTSLVADPNPTVGAAFDADLDELASLIGVSTPSTAPAAEPAPEEIEVVEPEPEPEPIAPVVKRLRGTGGILRANLVIAEGGEVEVSEGDSIPGGWTITSIVPDRVVARHEDGDEDVRLIFATRIAMADEPALPPMPAVVPEPGLSGGFNPIGTNSVQNGTFPVPGGFSGF